MSQKTNDKIRVHRLKNSLCIFRNVMQLIQEEFDFNSEDGKAVLNDAEEALNILEEHVLEIEKRHSHSLGGILS